MVLFADLLAQLQPQAAPAPEPPATPPTPSTTKGHGRRRRPEDLPRRRMIHDLPEEEKPCPCCGRMRDLIGEETSEQLEYEAAEKPLTPIEKGLAAPGLLAYVIVNQYSDHLPLYRLERILKRHKIDIARSTMCDRCRESAEALKPLYDLMVREVLVSKVMHTDDTPVDVLDHSLPETRVGRFWVYVGDRDHPHNVFTYTANRSRDGPVTFLKDWGKDVRRFLQTDAATATQALAYIRLLYDVEDEAKAEFERQEAGSNAVPSLACQGEALRSLAEIRLTLRLAKAVPLLAQFKAWLKSRQATSGGPVLPKSAMGQAVAYALNPWDALNVYVTDGRLAIDNNTAENALRRVAIGRKNGLFCGSDTGGHTAAVLFPLIATCQRHDVDPFAYLRDVLTRIAAHPMHRLAERLPEQWKLPSDG
jgi:transposase